MDNLILGNRFSDYVPDLYSRSEDAEIKMITCPDCNGTKRIFFSACCGAEIIDGICQDIDCLQKCNEDSDECLNCDDNGEVEE